jgi:hypothetical protein
MSVHAFVETTIFSQSGAIAIPVISPYSFIGTTTCELSHTQMIRFSVFEKQNNRPTAEMCVMGRSCPLMLGIVFPDLDSIAVT